MTQGSDSSTPIGLYGKIGSQPDFFRANAGEFSQAGLDRFFQDAMEALRGEGTAVPESPTAFALGPAGAPQSFVGSFARSSDSAGRAFPLVVFASVPTGDLIDDLPGVLATQELFIQAAGGLSTAEANGLSAQDVLDQLRTLSLGVGGADANGWARGTAAPLLAAVNGSAAALGYALRTVASACDQAVKAGINGRSTPITVDAPAPTATIRAWWIELVRRRLKWRDACPALMWTEGPAGRLLITLGHPSPSAISYLCNPRHRATRFWPLRTTVTAAIDTAMNSLTPEQRQRVETPGTSLADLMASFS